ncbi:hypothetical protein ACFSR9_06930 [Deinococcus taklimakanensis]|uniref:Uncharacterized protein n=1 Tax=Deinococcus taklimakanensis TaxID=536443 RepID=A0ABW5P4K2_9DEIO
MKRLVSLLILSSSPALGASSAPQVFVKLYADGAELLQWTEGTGGQLMGTYQLVAANPSLTQLTTRNEAFSGTRRGTALSFRFDRTVLGIADSAVWTATLNGAALTLNRPKPAGFTSTVLTKSTLAAYNQAVTRLASQVQARKQVAAQQAQQQAAQRAAVDAQTNTVRGVNRRASRALADAADLITQLKDNERDLAAVNELFADDLAKLRTDTQTLFDHAAEVRTSRDCYEMRQVQGYDLSQLTGYDLSQLTGYDTSELRRVTAQVNRDLQAALDLRQTLADIAQTASRLQGTTSLSTEAWQVDGAALAKASQSLALQAQQLQGALTRAVTAQKDSLSQAEQLLAQARHVAGSLTCTP